MIILFINLGLFYISKLLFNNYCYDKKIDIICIQETFEHKVKPHLSGWKCYSKPRKMNAKNTNPNGRVSILGRHNVKLN